MSQEITSEIISIFEKFPKTIDGKDAILEMKNNNGKKLETNGVGRILF